MQENPTVWLFDLDNTLHDADAGIFHLINRAMTRYMARRLKLSESAASDLRQDYWHRYGATLAGLQIHHPEIDIAEFLRESHPIDAILTKLHGMADTENTLCRLNGRKAVFPTARRFTSVPLPAHSVWKTVSTHCSARMISDCCTNPIRKRISMSAACWTYRPNAALWWTTARTTSIRQKHWA